MEATRWRQPWTKPLRPSTTPFPFAFDSHAFAAFGKKRFDDFVHVQTELLDEIQEANRHWFDRLQSEANLASEFASKLTSARTIPDAMTASQEWVTQYLAMLSEDGKQLADDTRKFMEAGAKLFAANAADEQPTTAS